MLRQFCLSGAKNSVHCKWLLIPKRILNDVMSELSSVLSVDCLTMNYMNILLVVVDIFFLPLPQENMTNGSCFMMQKLFQDMMFKILTLTAHGKWPTQQTNFIFPGAPIYLNFQHQKQFVFRSLGITVTACCALNIKR